MTDKHEKAPDLLLTTARTLRDHMHNTGAGKMAGDLEAALKPSDDAEKAAQEKAQAKAK